MTTIGFIGVGLMGYGPALHILEAGYPLRILGHHNRAPVENLLARGAREVGDPAELARAADIVITCLPSSVVLEGVVLDERGLLAGARDGQLLVDMTTADPRSTRRLAAALADKGVRMIDAPMTRTPREAREGRLNLLLGGAEADIDEAEPVLATYSEHRFRTGALGTAHTVKLINNFLSLGHAALAAEAAATADAAGVDPKVLREVVSVGGADSRMFRMVMSYVTDGDETSLEFAIGNAMKDYGYYLDMAREAGIVPQTAPAIHRLYALATALGHGREHVPRLYDMLKDLRIH